MVAGDSSEEESDNEDSNGTQWNTAPFNIIVGSEEGLYNNLPPASPTSPSQHIPVLGGPFSALINSMWPQDILGQVQQVSFIYITASVFFDCKVFK